VDVYARAHLLDADFSSDMSDSEQADDDLPSGEHDLPSGEQADDDLPSGEQCQKASEEFAAVTGTDTALAMFYLQDVRWSLEAALNNYFRDQEDNASQAAGSSGIIVVQGKGQNKDGIAIMPLGKTCRPSSSNNADNGESSNNAAGDKSRRVRVLSWNIDGLDTSSLMMRAKGVCVEIEREDPDVVFLQEAVSDNINIIESKLISYKCIRAGGDGYFVAMLLKNSTVTYEDHCIESYGQSRMGRNLLMVKCRLRGVPVLLMTSHLESMKNYAAERQRQLKICFDNMKAPPEPNRVVIFGGDLNIRDAEIANIGGVPSDAVDLWESTGKRKEAQFTWDMSLNDNKEMPPGAKFKCRCRFDRLYLRQPSDTPPKFKPVYFELAGIERLKDCRRFCSDHWGILAHLDVL